MPDLSNGDDYVVMSIKLDGDKEERMISVPASGVAARESRGWKVAKPSDAAKSGAKES